MPNNGSASKQYLNYENLPVNVPKSDDWTVVQKTDLSWRKSEVSNEKISLIEASQINFEKIIGNGSFGQVWKGKWRSTMVAIKQVKNNSLTLSFDNAEFNSLNI